jgi:hypothetical protein
MLLKFSVQYSTKAFISFQFSLLFLCCFGSGYRNLGSVIILASYFSKVFMRLVSFIFIFGCLLRFNQALLLKEVLKILYYRLFSFFNHPKPGWLPLDRSVLFFWSRLLFEFGLFLLLNPSFRLRHRRGFFDNAPTQLVVVLVDVHPVFLHLLTATRRRPSVFIFRSQPGGPAFPNQLLFRKHLRRKFSEEVFIWYFVPVNSKSPLSLMSPFLWFDRFSALKRQG